VSVSACEGGVWRSCASLRSVPHSAALRSAAVNPLDTAAAASCVPLEPQLSRAVARMGNVEPDRGNKKGHCVLHTHVWKPSHASWTKTRNTHTDPVMFTA